MTRPRSRRSIACSSRSGGGRIPPFRGSIGPRVKVDARGFIEVDPARRTAEPSIFAIGDVVGEPMLAHKASHEGRVAVEAIAGEHVGLRAAGDPRRGLHRSRDRVVRAHRERGARREPRSRPSRRFPWGASGRAHDARSLRRADQADSGSEDRTRPRRRASSVPAPAS